MKDINYDTLLKVLSVSGVRYSIRNNNETIHINTDIDEYIFNTNNRSLNRIISKHNTS